jgi:hypothetical protein
MAPFSTEAALAIAASTCHPGPVLPECLP